jgi:hypothetical protein
MAVGVKLYFEGLGTSEYNKLHDLVIEEGTPKGLLSHTAGEAKGGVLIFDIWESADAFNTFMKDTLAPRIEKSGIKIAKKPEPTIYELYNIWTPGVSKLEKLGENSRPLARV